MKRVVLAVIFSVCLLAGCAGGTSRESEQTPGQPSLSVQDDVGVTSKQVNAELEKYLSEHVDYVEPICEEWENENIEIEDNTLYKVTENGSKEEVLSNVKTWAPFGQHSIIAVHDDLNLVQIDTLSWNTSTMYESDRILMDLHTDGSLIFMATDTQVYRYFVPTGTLDLIATDDLFATFLAPVSTADICWLSYNPIWLKKFYELGSEDNIYNVNRDLYAFCNTRTGDVYKWEPEEVSQSYENEGLQWYSEQIKK